MNNIAINESPELASRHVEDFRAPPIRENVTDQNRIDAAKEYENRSLLRKLNPNAVTAAELMRSKSRKVVVENTAALQAYPQAQQDAVLQALHELRAEMLNLGAQIDNLGAELRTRSSNNVTVRSQNSLSLSLAVFITS